MEKLWSPWRSKYIDSLKDKNPDEGCIFCNASKKDIYDLDNLLVHKSELTFTLLNLYPYNNGHLMIVPFRHTGDFSSLTGDEGSMIIKELQLAQHALTKILKPEGYNIGANLGRVSGAGIDEHIHFHIVPRWSGDTNFMPVLGEVKVISQELRETKSKLLEAYKKLK